MAGEAGRMQVSLMRRRYCSEANTTCMEAKTIDKEANNPRCLMPRGTARKMAAVVGASNIQGIELASLACVLLPP